MQIAVLNDACFVGLEAVRTEVVVWKRGGAYAGGLEERIR